MYNINYVLCLKHKTYNLKYIIGIVYKCIIYVLWSLLTIIKDIHVCIMYIIYYIQGDSPSMFIFIFSLSNAFIQILIFGVFKYA